MKTIYTVLCIASAAWLAAPQVVAAEASWQQCRSLTDATARLRCYDSLPLPSPFPGELKSGSATMAIPGDNLGASITTPAANQFGLEDKKVKEAVSTVDSQIIGLFEGWHTNSRIKLANGQVWQVSDDSSRSLELNSPKVTIRRGALGTFFLELEGTNYSPRVKRIQ